MPTLSYTLNLFTMLLLKVMADDDYSPEEAVKLFPSSQNSHQNPHNTHFPTPPPKATLATLKLDPERVYSIMNLDHDKLSHYDNNNASLSSRDFNPAQLFKLNRNSSEFYFNDNNCWNLFGVSLDKKVVPILIISIGVVAIIANSLPLISFITSKKLRNGQNMLLLNVVLSDMIYVCTLVPITSIHFSPTHPQFPSLQTTTCRIGHYVIFVSVYVSMYTLVVACLFGLMNGLCYNKPSDLIASHGLKSQSSKYLSIFSSGILCLVVWLSFLLSHAHILLPSSNHLISSSIYQPFICNIQPNQYNQYRYPSHRYDHDVHHDDNGKVKTLWVTFLTCAFIIPLFVVIFISAFVLTSNKSNCHSYPSNCRNNCNNSYNKNYSNNYSNSSSYDDNKTGNFYESVQNNKNHYKNKKDLATVVMVTAVVRVLCWLPTIIVLFIAARTTEEGMECGSLKLLKRFELLALCVTLLCSIATPGILFGLVEDFKGWLMWCGKRQKKKKTLVIGGMTLNPPVTHRSSLLRQMNEGSKMNETIMSIISDSSNHINYLG